MARRKIDPERVAYRPSNSDEGYWFETKWCDLCTRQAANRRDENKAPCRILLMTNAFGVDDPEYPLEWREDGPEGPRCTAFRSVEDVPPRKRREGPAYNPDNAVGDLFR